MKLLSRIAFLLLTFSAFSQEKLSYQDGIIKQGEEVLSLEELSVLVNGANITLPMISQPVNLNSMLKRLKN